MSNEKPPGDDKKKVIEFAKPDGWKRPPQKLGSDPLDAPTIPEDPLDIRDEKYRKGHRELRKKFNHPAIEAYIARYGEHKRAQMDALSASVRNTLIDQVASETGHPRDEVAKNHDTQLLTERAEADLDEDEYVRLRELSGEESEAILEVAYAKARAKYGDMYPAADETMFGRFKIPKISSETSKPQEATTSLIDKIRNRLKNLF